MTIKAGVVLLAAMTAEMRVLYNGLDLDGPDMPRAGALELGPPTGTYLVGYDLSLGGPAGPCAAAG